MKSRGFGRVLSCGLVLIAATSPVYGVTTISNIYGAPGFDPESGNGYKGIQEIVYLVGTLLARDGTVLSRHDPFIANIDQGTTHSLWRADDEPTIFPVVPPEIHSFANGLSNSRLSIGRHDGNISRWSAVGEVTSFPFTGDAIDINDSGQMIAYGNHALSWNAAGERIDLHIPSEVQSSFALSINNAGQIAGGFQSGEAVTPVRWEQDGSATMLGTTFSSGLALDSLAPRVVNSKGAVAGMGYNGSSVQGESESVTGVYWNESGQPVELDHLPFDAIYDMDVMDINEHGQVIGAVDGLTNGVFSKRGVRWSPDGSVVELERFATGNESRSAWPFEINKFGYVVGSAGPTDADFANAVLWDPNGEITVLNSLRPSGSLWSFGSVATAITDTGWITGVGSFNPEGPAPSYRRAWSILVPEAGTYGLGDANFDEAIDFADLLLVAQNYGLSTNGSVDMGDFDLDGIVDFTDLLTVAQNYGDDPSLLPGEASATFVSDWNFARSLVPEPDALAGIVIVGGLIRRRLRRPECRAPQPKWVPRSRTHGRASGT